MYLASCTQLQPRLPTNPGHRIWQRTTSQATHAAMQTEFHRSLDPAKPCWRILLLRHLRLPLPLAQRRCGCRRSGARCLLKRAAARISREAGARVTNTLLTDLNLPAVDPVDNRRIDVIANGLPLFHGATRHWCPHFPPPANQPRRRGGAYAGVRGQKVKIN